LEIECIKMELGEPDASGRRRPIEIKGSEFMLKADKLIMATGQKSAVPEGFGLQLNKKGTIQADEETLACSKKGIFAGGDVVSGPASIIEAIQHGRMAASEIDKFLGGTGQVEQKFMPEDIENPYIGREEKFAYKKRISMPTLPVDKRKNNFALVDLGIDEKLAIEEAERCLKCQLRLKISQAPLPPEQQTE
jgi:NADPH-dependent glutamate synthase beta subunit-like oxidoreductase